MIKKSLSLTLIVCMIMSLFIITPVSAGAPVVLDGTTRVIFNQNFGGLADASDLNDFAVSGSNWSYMDHFMIADGGNRSVMTKSNYDLSDCAYYTFSTKLSCTSNGYYIYLAYEGGKGYVLAYHNNTNKLALFDGEPAASNSTTGALATVGFDVYDKDTTINVKYEKATKTLTVTNSANSNVITYTPEDGSVPNLNGKFGVKGNYAGVLTLFNMSLTKHYDSVTVDEWKYDKTFSSKDTIAGLEAEGYAFSNTGFTVNDSGIKSANNNRRVTFGPDGKDLSGSYYFETQVQRSQNSYHLEFNKSSAGYYRVWYGVNDSDAAKNKPWIKLQKYDASTSATHDLVVVSRPSGLSSGHTRTYKVWVKNLEDGSVDLKVEIYNGSTLDATLEYTDTATDTKDVTTTQNVTDAEGNIVYEEDGVTPKTEEVTTAVDTGAPLTSGKISVYWQYCGTNSYLKYLNAYSILEASAGEPVTVSQSVINKTFSSADNADTLTAAGFVAGGTRSYSDANGVYWTASKGPGTNYLYYNTVVSGTYTFNTNIRKKTNGQEVYFNRADANSYYALKYYYKSSGSSSNHYKLVKKINGGDEMILASKALTSSADMGYNCWMDVTISVTEDAETGALTINTSTQSGTRTPITMTYTDTATDMIDADGDGVEETNTGAPLTAGGYCRIAYNYAGANEGKCLSFKITKYVTEMQGGTSEIPEYSAVFYGDSGVINELTNGNIYFEYPVARLGTYTVVATLHEGNEMTGLKVLSPLDLYSGKNLLFSVTDVESAKVRVYFFDAEDTLNRLTQVYELN